VTAAAGCEGVLAAGFTACLRKPVDPDDFCEKIARAMAG
jgi:hypothetical protein